MSGEIGVDGGLEVSGVRKIELNVIANAEDLITERFRMLCK